MTLSEQQFPHQPGAKVRINVPEDDSLRQTKWYPKGEVTGTVQKVFKNGKVAVAVDQLRNVQDSGDGLRTLHFHRDHVEPR